MTWVTANWFWILVFGAFIAMHMFGHGGHGGGGHRDGMDMKEDDEAQKDIVNKSSSGHRH
jgi:hypothetical protein